MKLYHLTPEARRDLREIRDWIAADNPARAAKVIADLSALFALISESPLIRAKRDDLVSARSGEATISRSTGSTDPVS